MYKKLAGMTGTADTEAPEFKKIYKLDVTVIPTHREMVRDDNADVVYRTDNEKYEAVVQEIEERSKKGQPFWSARLPWPSPRSSRACSRSRA
jgi:preprotein translocase subunit SecA